jgi:predicted acylesterase/phospholipase RssA
MQSSKPQTTVFQTALGVFEGGGCRAAAYAGAYAEATERGVHFEEVAGSSAGAITAALIAAGCTPRQLIEWLEELDFTHLLTKPDRPPSRPVRRFWSLAVRMVPGAFGKYGRVFTHLGRYSSRAIEEWLNERLRELVPASGRVVTFRDLSIPLWIVAADLKRRDVVVFSQQATPDKSVAEAARASASIPLFFQPVDFRYVDGGAVSNLPSFVYSITEGTSRPESSNVLGFSLIADQDPQETENIGDIAGAMLNTVLDGAQSIQHKLVGHDHIVRIPTGQFRAIDFHLMDSQAKSFLVESGRRETAKFLENEKVYYSSQKRDRPIPHRPSMLRAVVEELNKEPAHFGFSLKSTRFVFDLFPALLDASMRGSTMQGLVAPFGDDAEADLQTAILMAMGASVTVEEGLPFEGFVFDFGVHREKSAIVLYQQGGSYAARYTRAYDTPIVNAMARHVSFNEAIPDAYSRPALREVSPDELFRRLKSLRQYSRPGVDMTIEDVPVEGLSSLSSSVREYKYAQAQVLLGRFKKDGLEPFVPAGIQFVDQSRSIVTPPVIEQHGTYSILIEGTARALLMARSGSPTFKAVVVRGVEDDLPAQRVDFRSVRLTASNEPLSKRYMNWNYDEFRHIEREVHRRDDYRGNR